MPALFRAIRARRNAPFLKEALEEVKAALEDDFKPYVKEDLESITAKWKHQPIWNIRKYVTGDPIKFTFNPKDDEAGQIFTYQDQGTKAHIIRPKKAGGVLAFEKDKATVFARVVHHPGTKAQNFLEDRKDGYQAEFRRVVENAFRRGLR